MRLADLDAGFVGPYADAAGAASGTATGLQFRCPKCRETRIVVPIDPPIGPGPVDPSLNARGILWRRTGDTVENITLTPSIDSKDVNGGYDGLPRVECHWHGFVQNGHTVDA